MGDDHPEDADVQMSAMDMNFIDKPARRGGDSDEEEDRRMRWMCENEDRRSRGRHAVAEMSSRPTVCESACERNMQGGWSLDWMIKDPTSGQTWDLRKAHVQRRVLGILRRDKPKVIVACPPCAMFPPVHYSSGNPETTDMQKWRDAVEMVDFAVTVCEEQRNAGRLFVLEQPLAASSWKLPSLKKSMRRPGTLQAVRHTCAFGVKAGELFGTPPAMKPTRFLTNSKAIHGKLIAVAAKAASYPQGLVDVILDGAEIENNAVLFNLQKAAVAADVASLHEKEFADWHYIDDITGETLDNEKVKAARKKEMDTFKEMAVYEYVRRVEATNSRSGKFVGVRWVDTLKDEKVKSRLVAQEFASKDGRDDLFAGTPPLAATRMLLSDVASRGRGGPGQRKIMILDIKRAFLHGEIEEEIYIELPLEDPKRLQGMVGRLKKAMYGTRAAPQVWQALVKRTMTRLGFVPSRVSPCVYYHRQRDMHVVTHVDDFLCGGDLLHLHWFRKSLEAEFELTCDILGDGPNDKLQGHFLGRRVTWTKGGIRYECDPKHAKILLSEWDMLNARAVSTPGVAAEKNIEEWEEKQLSQIDATRFRRAAARVNYMALDRLDLSFAAKELSRAMAGPTEGDVVRLKRVLRYLRGTPRIAFFYKWQDAVGCLVTFSDSDWAGCVKTRRSTSGGVVTRGAHTITHWSSTQATVALSSGEAELNALVKAGSETLGLIHLYSELGNQMYGELRTDSSAAKGIAQRSGCGRVKHLEARQLWIQEAVNDRDLKVNKIERKINHSDALTHHWLAHEGEVHFRALGMNKCGLRE